ncbi:hypothetical protein [Salinibacillus xinjiangensis]|uniref:Alpha/beta hydrolase n=1 Tax=Salinibacillus xinjiangensis TaxID=1229268 RepID=A0A6G1XB56_9BACI|nr:hypothetical protein [Salinibacillus xinjiangensis]MRG88110.1 hypothetical protein [Salinibacillus xinjiangensis]
MYEKGEKQANKMFHKALSTDQDVVKYQFTKVNAKWYREHFAFNTRESLQQVHVPILAIMFDKDSLSNTETLKELPQLVKGQCEPI